MTTNLYVHLYTKYSKYEVLLLKDKNSAQEPITNPSFLNINRSYILLNSHRKKVSFSQSSYVLVLHTVVDI